MTIADLHFALEREQEAVVWTDIFRFILFSPSIQSTRSTPGLLTNIYGPAGQPTYQRIVYSSVAKCSHPIHDFVQLL